MRLSLRPSPKFPELGLGEQGWPAFLSELAAEIGSADDLVEVSFLGDEEMRTVNRDYRGMDRPTDVLSFSYGRCAEGLLAADEDPVGEILLSVETAARQALTAGHSLAEELSVLVIHGLYHILGHDHEDDAEAAVMAALEAPHRGALHRFFASDRERS